MGCPDIYYKRALQNFAHCLAAEDNNWLLANQLHEEECNAILESFILEKKDEVDEKLFFYDAGRACQCTFDEAYEEGCDALNASCGGIYGFECFIGLIDDEDDD